SAASTAVMTGTSPRDPLRPAYGLLLLRARVVVLLVCAVARGIERAGVHALDHAAHDRRGPADLGVALPVPENVAACSAVRAGSVGALAPVCAGRTRQQVAVDVVADALAR